MSRSTKITLILTVLLTSACWALLSSYWGYVWFRPATFSELRDAKRVEAIELFTGDIDGLQSYSLPIDEAVQGGIGYEYESSVRSLVALNARGLLDQDVERRELLSENHVVSAIRSAGVLASSEPGYRSESHLCGVITGFTSDSGDRFLYLEMNGGQVSNDHYPHYEVLFRLVPGGQPEVLKSQSYFFDEAGMEGTEGWWLAIVMVVPALVAAFIGATLLNAATELALTLRRRLTRKNL